MGIERSEIFIQMKGSNGSLSNFFPLLDPSRSILSDGPPPPLPGVSCENQLANLKMVVFGVNLVFAISKK